MTRRRWIADEIAGDSAVLVGAHAEHLARVLRAQVGQEFDIVANGVVRRGRIRHLEASRVEFQLGEEVSVVPVPPVTLLMSVFKFDRMEWAIEKCTELGAIRIVPLIAQRTEKHLAAAANKRVERWRRVARQASEQSRRSVPLEVADPLGVKDAVSMAGSLRIILDESEQERMLRAAVDEKAPVGEIVLAFGPEGGWTPAELEQFHAAGWKSASLGNTVLRAETAAIAALAVVMAQLQ